MGTVIRWPGRGHARASDKKSSGVTAPPVTAAIRSATLRDGQAASSQSCVTLPFETPMRAANSRRLTPFSFNQSASFMMPIFSSTETSAQLKFSAAMDGRWKERPQNHGMTDTPFRPTLIRKWRKHRRMTLEKLAEAAGMSTGNLSNIERGVTGYNQETLESLAMALGCHPAELLMRDPGEPTPLWKLWDEASEMQRKQIVAVIESLLKSTAA